MLPLKYVDVFTRVNKGSHDLTELGRKRTPGLDYSSFLSERLRTAMSGRPAQTKTAPEGVAFD